jgi:hypothetical protein
VLDIEPRYALVHAAKPSTVTPRPLAPFRSSPSVANCIPT